MRALGLDIGDVRIGVALSDPDGLIAQPLEIIDRKTSASDGIGRIKELVDEYEADEIVAGLPLTMEGEPGPQAKAVTEYVRELERIVGVPIKLWDERLTTVMVDRTMVSADVKRRKRKKLVDQLAAAVILQGYLDARRMRKKEEPTG
ncbi:MAG: Holliday junction resolvase RuvX [Candidatus Aquicultorales bacterium]